MKNARARTCSVCAVFSVCVCVYSVCVCTVYVCVQCMCVCVCVQRAHVFSFAIVSR